MDDPYIILTIVIIVVIQITLLYLLRRNHQYLIELRFFYKFKELNENMFSFDKKSVEQHHLNQ